MDGDHKECRVSASVAKNSVSHALSCAGGGCAMRHNVTCDITATLLQEVTSSFEVEPI